MVMQQEKIDKKFLHCWKAMRMSNARLARQFRLNIEEVDSLKRKLIGKSREKPADTRREKAVDTIKEKPAGIIKGKFVDVIRGKPSDTIKEKPASAISPKPVGIIKGIRYFLSIAFGRTKFIDSSEIIASLEIRLVELEKKVYELSERRRSLRTGERVRFLDGLLDGERRVLDTIFHHNIKLQKPVFFNKQ